MNRVEISQVALDAEERQAHVLPATAGLPPFISFSTSYPELDSAVRRPIRRIASERFLQQHHESVGTTSATRRSICSASSKTGLSRISSAPASATSRRPRTQASGGPETATASRPLNSKNG